MREGIYPAYKLARREKNADLIHEPSSGPSFKAVSECLRLCGVEQVYADGIEADDLIAAAHRCARARYPEEHVTIMSSDKDLMQLIDTDTDQLRFSSYGTPTDLWTEKRVIDELGYLPSQIPALMALTGDQVDGIPGAKGIGPVKALKLLQQHDWDWRAVAATLPDADMVETSWRLVNLLGVLPCQPFDSIPVWKPLTRTSPNSTQHLELFTDFCAQYQLREIWTGVVEGTLWS
jgi:5'-3' exonuclease